MKAMILAAGLGARLKPLTDSLPKALLPVAGNPLLYYLIIKLIKTGISEVIINVHHHAEKIVEYLKKNKNFGIRIEISIEDLLLDTGGGLKKAAWFFDDRSPFILHNVDVLSSIDLIQMINYHLNNDALATLAVRKRKTSRYLLFDEKNQLAGWHSVESEKTELARKTDKPLKSLSFLGIHVISPEIFSYLPSEKSFSIIKAYLQLARDKKLVAYPNDSDFWLDLGRKENFESASEFIKKGKYE